MYMSHWCHNVNVDWFTKSIYHNRLQNVLRFYCNQFHNILRLFDVLPNFPFTKSETMGDYLRAVSRVAERLIT